MPTTTSSGVQLTPAQREQIRKRQVANILAKLQSGKSISAREQALLDGNDEAFSSKVSISQLAQLTGKDRRTIASRVSDLKYVGGDKGAYLYESSEALEAIYLCAGKSLDEAKKEQALSSAALNRTRDEVERRRRIPIDVPLRANDQAIQSLTALLKAAKGQILTEAKINELLEGFREIPAKLKW